MSEMTIGELQEKLEAQQTAFQKRLNEQKGKFEDLINQQTGTIQNLTAELEAKRKSVIEGATTLETLQQQIQTLTQDVTTQKEAAAQAQQAALRAKIGAAHGLPADLFDRLQGADEAALAADAAALAGFLKPPAPGSLPRNNGNPPVGVTAAQLNDPEWVDKNMDKAVEAFAAAAK